MENIQEIKIENKLQEQVQPQVLPTTFDYLNLVKKLREVQKQSNQVQEDVQEELQEESKNEVKEETKPKIRGLKTNSKPQTNFRPRIQKLSSEEYQKKLINCQTIFMNELNRYLKEEIKTNEKQEQETNESKKITDKVKFSKRQTTNLERIQNGSGCVNIIRIISSRVESSKMEYFENLIKNKQINFVYYLGEFMNKYDVRTTYKSLNTILLHSPYIIV
jgi:hypothetical protein